MWPKQKGWAEQEKLEEKQSKATGRLKGFLQCFIPEYELFSRTTSSAVNKSLWRFAKEVETSPEILAAVSLTLPVFAANPTPRGPRRE